VPALGDANHGFPYLSGVGRLIVKDAIMLGAAFLTLTDAARASLRRRTLNDLVHTAEGVLHTIEAAPMPHRPTILAALFAAVAVVALAPTARAAAHDDDDARMTAVADFNRDDIADIAQVLPGDGSELATLKISLGNASGGFRSLSSAPVLGRTPKAIAAADFNGDGIPDLVVGDDDGSLKLFLGDGTGNFAPAPDVARLDSVVSIAVADFNGDGRPDVAVSDWRAGSVSILLGDGKGAFRLGWLFRLPTRGNVARVSAADFNGDGIPDLAIIYGDGDDYTFDVMLGDGKGVFVHSPKLSFTRDPNSHCPA
jgi:FG-GAP-like repeat/Protein of unknown function, DUF417